MAELLPRETHSSPSRSVTGMIIVEDEWRTILEVRLEDIIDGGKEE